MTMVIEPAVERSLAVQAASRSTHILKVRCGDRDDWPLLCPCGVGDNPFG